MILASIATGIVLFGAAVSAFFYGRKSGHSVSISREQIPSLKSFRYVYRYLQISTLVVSISSFWSDSPLLLRLYSSETAVTTGIGISLIGLLLFVWAMTSLGSALSPCYDSYLPNEPVTKGIYSWIRHPLYTSNVVQMIGLFIATGSVILGFNAMLMIRYYITAARIEEKALSIHFPEYREHVSRSGAFLPQIRKSVINTHQSINGVKRDSAPDK